MSTKTKIGNLLKKYSDNTTIRAGVNAIPYIGGTLDILLTSGIQKKSQERFSNFINELENQIQKIDEKKLDHTYLESEEFYDLFLQSSNLAIRTRIQEKIKAYAKILTCSLVSEFKNNLNAEDVLNIIEQLTENDIKLIKLISEYLELEDAERINSDKVFGASSFTKISEDTTDDFILVGLLRLLKSSLIIKHPVKSAPLAKLSFLITPLFDIVKYFVIK